jgi:hypothetical protein
MKLLMPILVVILAIMFFAGIAQSSQNLIAVQVKDAPIINGSVNDAAWKSAKSITVKDNRVDEEVTIKAVYTSDMIFFSVRFPDPEEDRLHKPWVWDKGLEVYKLGSQREDTFTFKWNMEGKEVDLSNYSDDQYTADVWYWKANRTDPVGYSDDKTHVLASTPGKKAKELVSKSGNKNYLMRIGDAGTSAQKKRLLTSYQGDVQDQYVTRKPAGSRADILARGVWKNGFWTIEFGRKLDTTHNDDIQFNPGSKTKYQFGISVAGLYGEKVDKAKPHVYGQGRLSDNLYLIFQ